LKWTGQGVQEVKETTKRYRSAVKDLEKIGVRFQSFFWTTGKYDAIAIVEAPDQETASTAALKTASLGNVRLETLRAYSADEMDRILAKIE
jgi:uncharacterized protein with GYD domain